MMYNIISIEKEKFQLNKRILYYNFSALLKILLITFSGLFNYFTTLNLYFILKVLSVITYNITIEIFTKMTYCKFFQQSIVPNILTFFLFLNLLKK